MKYINFESEFNKIKSTLTTQQEKNINSVFTNKGLGLNVLINLINEDLIFDEMSVIEKIALAQGLYSIGYEQFKPSGLFTANELIEYKMFVPNFNRTNVMHFKNVYPYDEKNYRCIFWEPLSQVEARLNRNIGYNFDMQRDAVVIVRHGVARKKIDIDRNKIEGIKECIRNGGYTPVDEITLGILLFNDNEPLFIYDEDKKTLDIESNPTIGKDLTRVVMLDGWNRDIALWELHNEGYNFDGFKGFPVQISLLTPTEGSAFVKRKSKSGGMKVTRVTASLDNSYNEIINKLNTEQNKDNNSIFFNNIAKTYVDMKVEHKQFNYEQMTEGLKKLEKNYGLDFNTSISRHNINKMLLEYINIINEYFISKNNDMIKKYKGLLYLFIPLSYEIKISEKDKFSLVDIFTDKVIQNEDIIKESKLNNKNYYYNNIYEFVLNLLKESEQ